MWLMGTGIALQFVGFVPEFYAMSYYLNRFGLEGNYETVPFPVIDYFVGVYKE